MEVSTARAPRLCPLVAFSRFAGGKYKLRILWELMSGPHRYGVLHRSVMAACQGKAVTPRILSRELKELTARGLIARRAYPVVPPKVEYALTAEGWRLAPIIRQVIEWGLDGGHDGIRSAPAAVRAARGYFTAAERRRRASPSMR